jgi:FkbM family methyltransferase
MYTIDIVRGLKFNVHTDEAKSWYDPIKPYTKLEYEWVLDNVDLTGNILECGGHHGHYSVVLGSKDGNLLVVEPHPENVEIILDNIDLNKQFASVWKGAVADYNGLGCFTGETNGRLISFGRTEVKVRTLKDLMPDASVIKLDIEGGEYNILPAGIEQMPNADTWIIELHPYWGNPHEICAAFLKAGFIALKVDRKLMRVIEYDMLDDWEGHATCIFLKK